MTRDLGTYDYIIVGAGSAGCVLAIGTSATVRPASGLLWIAEAAGAKIVEINPTETKLTPLSEVSLRATAGMALPALLNALS